MPEYFKIEKTHTMMIKDKVFSGTWFRSYLFIVVGTFIMAFAYVFFINPYKIVPGGVYGISIVLHHLFGTPIGGMALIFNIPITLIGIKILGPRFGFKTVIGFILGAVFIDTLNYFSKGQPLVDNDPLLSSIFGGTILGLGIGLFFKSKATAGGSDVISMIISKYSKIPLGHLMIIVDSSIVLLGLVAFRDWRIPLYSWIVIFIMGKVIDVVLEGISYDKMLIIITDNPEEIGERICDEINRSTTVINCSGFYSKQEKKLMFTVLNRREVDIIIKYLRKYDPAAFIIVSDVKEIYGEGFRPLEKYSR